MDWGTFVYAWLSVTGIALLLGTVVHGFLLKGAYASLPAIFRPVPLRFESILGHLVIGLVFCFIFVDFHDTYTLAVGARYGLLIGLLLAAPFILMHAAQPVPVSVALASGVATVVERVATGVILASIYGDAAV